MSKTIKEQIKVMQHYANFNDEVEQLYITTSSAISEKWTLKSSVPFDWQHYDYRIKEQKKTINIEKWLIESDGRYIVKECNDSELLKMVNSYNWKKVKLLETYEVEL